MTKELHDCWRRKTGNACRDQARQPGLKDTENKMTVLALYPDHDAIPTMRRSFHARAKQRTCQGRLRRTCFVFLASADRPLEPTECLLVDIALKGPVQNLCACKRVCSE